MKKIVSLALSTAMAFSMFASVTSAATLTTQEKYNALVTQGIFAGYPNGEAYLDKDMTRAEFAKVVALLTGLDTTATTTSTYVDPNYANAWYKPYVEAVTKAGYMKGTTTGTKKLFNPNGKVTVQEMAATLVRAAKLEIPTTGIDNGAAAWAKGEVQAAINAGLISKTANFAGAATRGLLVDTAYAYQTALSKPAVASYEVTDNGATVVFTLANGEKVTVKPTTALQPNVATTVTFKYNDFDYSESVTWKVTDATAVTSASATNLKQVMVMFNGKVDKTSAENTNNYAITDMTISSAKLSDDGTTVTLLLSADGGTLSNNRQATVRVSNVKQATGTTLISQSVNFTPSDVAVPTVTAVNALGTGAVEVVFSEPVRGVTANNIQIDGRAVAANVSYDYKTNSAVIETPVAVGDHTIRVSGVSDYSGLVIAPVEQKFTVVADTTAPTIVSTTSNDLKEVTVTFSEPIRSITSATANTVNGTAEITRSGRTVTLKFPNDLSFSANTITLNGVTDYSGNVAQTLTATVTPTLDLTAPTVLGTSVGTENGNYYVDVQFSKTVNTSTANGVGSALERANYTLRNANGSVSTASGLTSDGHPVVTPRTIGNNDRTVRVTLGPTSALTAGSYTFEVAGVRDMTTAKNILTPYKTTVALSTSAAATLNRTWIGTDGWVYVEFSNTVATTGTGNALDASKYRLENLANPNTGTPTRVLTDRNTDIETVGANTIRIYPRNFAGNTSALVNNYLIASYVSNVDGTYFTTSDAQGRVEARKQITTNASAVSITNTLNFNSDRKIAVTFSSPVSGIALSNVSLNIAGTNYNPIAVTPTSGSNSNVTFTFADSVPNTFTAATLNVNGVTDTFSNTVNVSKAVNNQFTPVGTSATAVRTADGFTVDIAVNRAVQVNGADATAAAQLFKASVGAAGTVTATNVQVVSGSPATAQPVGTSGSVLRVTFPAPTGNAANYAAANNVVVDFNGAGNAARLIATGNTTADTSVALGNFSVSATLAAASVSTNPAVINTVTATNATTATVKFNEAVVVPNNTNAAGQFTVLSSANGATPVAATDVIGSGTDTLTLTFPAGTFVAGATPTYTLSYTQSATASNRVVDLDSNPTASTTTPVNVTNNVQ